MGGEKLGNAQLAPSPSEGTPSAAGPHGSLMGDDHNIIDIP